MLRQADVGKDAADRLAAHFGGVGGLVVERLNCREDDGFSFALKAAVRFRRGRRLICSPLQLFHSSPGAPASQVVVPVEWLPSFSLLPRSDSFGGPHLIQRTPVPSLFVQHLALAYPQSGAFEGERLQEKHMAYGFRAGMVVCFSMILILLCSPLCFSSQAQVSPEPSDLVMVDLTCDSSVDPFGVDDPQPRLHWSLKARGEQLRNVQQTAFQILVASSRTRLDRDSADVWDTNKTSTSMAPSVSYAGPPLVSDTVYYWKVRVWDQRGRPSTWSETATFLTGLLQPSDWHAHWIAADPDGPRQPHARGNDDMRVAFAPPTAHLSRYVSSQQACRARNALPFRPR